MDKVEGLSQKSAIKTDCSKDSEATRPFFRVTQQNFADLQ